MPYVYPFDPYSDDDDENSVCRDFVEEDVPNDIGPMKPELNNNDDNDTLLSMISFEPNDQTVIAGFLGGGFCGGGRTK